MLHGKNLLQNEVDEEILEIDVLQNEIDLLQNEVDEQILEIDVLQNEIDLLRNEADEQIYEIDVLRKEIDVLRKDVFCLRKGGSRTMGKPKPAHGKKSWGTRLQPDAPPDKNSIGDCV